MFNEIPLINFGVWSLIRFLLYQLLIVFSFYNFHDLPKYTLEFKEKIEQFSVFSNIEFPSWLKEQLDNPENMFMIILAIAFVSGLLATLGFKLFQFISGALILVLAAVYYPPLKPSELGPDEPYEVLAQKYPWVDTVLISFFGILMILHSLKNFKDEDFYFLKEDSGQTTVNQPASKESEKTDKESKKNR